MIGGSPTRVDHIGIAVRSLDETVRAYRRGLGIDASPIEVVAAQRVRVSFAEVGDSHLEFLEPTEPSSTVAKFLEERGEGLHHVAFQVPNVDAHLGALEAEGVRLVDRVGRPGARGRRVGFAHPSAFHGVLVEFVEVA